MSKVIRHSSPSSLMFRPSLQTSDVRCPSVTSTNSFPPQMFSPHNPSTEIPPPSTSVLSNSPPHHSHLRVSDNVIRSPLHYSTPDPCPTPNTLTSPHRRRLCEASFTDLTILDPNWSTTLIPGLPRHTRRHELRRTDPLPSSLFLFRDTTGKCSQLSKQETGGCQGVRCPIRG